MRDTPIRKIVAIGDSITWGAGASDESKRWVNLTVQMLQESQGVIIEIINRGICANVLTPKCPAYQYSSGLTAVERAASDIVAYKPDMVLLAYGLNDSRGGTPVEVFREEYQRLIVEIKSKINPIIVLLNTFYMHEVFYSGCDHWNESNYDIADVYNLVISQLCLKNGLIFADVYSAQAGVDWAVSNDHCHPNNLGHRIIANRVFEAIARNCSFSTGI